MRVLFRDFQSFRSQGVQHGDFVFAKGTLTAFARKFSPTDFDRVCHGPGFLLPLLCDMHFHGGWGRGFAREDDFEFLEKKLKEQGYGEIVPTYMNTFWEGMADVVAAFRRYREGSGSNFFPFLRIEGPFLNPEMAGYQDQKSMRRISAAELRKLEALAPELRMMTVAPELPGMDRLLAAAKQQQILLSAGHSRATLADFRRFLAAGFCHLTHFGNQMSALHQRELGLMGAGLFLAETFCEVIGDSRHTADEFVELLFRSKHGRRIALVSDCIPSSFAHSGQLQRNGLARRDRLLQTADGTIAGGETMLLSQVRHLKERTSIPMVQLVNAVSRIPRQFLGIIERPRRFLAVDEKFQVIFVNS